MEEHKYHLHLALDRAPFLTARANLQTKEALVRVNSMQISPTVAFLQRVSWLVDYMVKEYKIEKQHADAAIAVEKRVQAETRKEEEEERQHRRAVGIEVPDDEPPKPTSLFFSSEEPEKDPKIPWREGEGDGHEIDPDEWGKEEEEQLKFAAGMTREEILAEKEELDKKAAEAKWKVQASVPQIMVYLSADGTHSSLWTFYRAKSSAPKKKALGNGDDDYVEEVHNDAMTGAFLGDGSWMDFFYVGYGTGTGR